jgi:pyruvate dehydrogenase E2 component (dihydrolipoamide acetyltransferase)
MTEGTLAKWLKKEGDIVSSGDVIAEIETDKATMEVEAVDEGKIAKILIAAGTENVPVNEVIALLLEEDEDESALSGFEAGKAAESKPVASDAPHQAQEQSAAQSAAAPSASNASNFSNSSGASSIQKADGRVFSSPLAKRIAAQAGVDLSKVTGTGPHGRIVKEDVEKAQKSGMAGAANAASGSTAGAKPSAPTAQGPDAKALADMLGMEYSEIPNNNIKKVTARRLLEAKQTIPHFYLTVECVLDNLLAAREELNAQANGAYKISVNDFVIKASAMALHAYPAANVSWTDAALLQYKHADISVAVATPNGLITPIIKKAETKGLAQISQEMKDLAGRAREGKLKPEEFQGGTFSISNLGMFGVQEFNAIVNPPQSCILAVGAGIQKPVVVNGQLEIKTVMSVTLSTDHRSVDGAVGAEFLQYLKRYIENPVSMLV